MRLIIFLRFISSSIFNWSADFILRRRKNRGTLKFEYNTRETFLRKEEFLYLLICFDSRYGVELLTTIFIRVLMYYIAGWSKKILDFYRIW